MKKFVKFGALFLAMVIGLTSFVGCKNDESKADEIIIFKGKIESIGMELEVITNNTAKTYEVKKTIDGKTFLDNAGIFTGDTSKDGEITFIMTHQIGKDEKLVEIPENERTKVSYTIKDGKFSQGDITYIRQ